MDGTRVASFQEVQDRLLAEGLKKFHFLDMIAF
jgi:hypothetical protein